MRSTGSLVLVMALAMCCVIGVSVYTLTRETGDEHHSTPVASVRDEHVALDESGSTARKLDLGDSEPQSIEVATIPNEHESSGGPRAKEIRLLVAPGTFSYSAVKSQLAPNDLAILYAFLDDVDEFESWGNVAKAIGAMGENERSYRVLTDYVKRPQRFSESPKYIGLSKSDVSHLLMDKILAVRWLPILDHEAGSELLSNILSSSVEAESFIEHWRDDEIPSGFGGIERAAMELRAAAAMGLVFTGLDENIVKVQEQLKVVSQHVREIPGQDGADVSEDQMIQNGRLLVFQSSLVEALAIGEYIKQHSAEAYFVASGTAEIHSEIRSRSRKIEEIYGLVN